MKIIAALVCFLLAGCASTLPKEVDVPVAQCIKTNIPAKPYLPIADLNTQSSYETIIKAYAQSVVKLQEALDAAIAELQAQQCA